MNDPGGAFKLDFSKGVPEDEGPDGHATDAKARSLYRTRRPLAS